MTSLVVRASAVALAVLVPTVAAAQPQPQPQPQAQPQTQVQAAGSRTDVYHVHFTKAVPGQAGALGRALMVPDPTSPMPDHFLVLRHQEGDDWDYVVIQHLGQKAAIDAAPTPPDPARDMRAWHNDTFVSGPPWAEFARAMGIGGSGNATNLVYVVGVHRPAPGRRDDLEKALNQPAPPDAKIQTGSVLLQHLEGADWTFMTLTRYNSWQDFAAERSQAAASPDSAGGWNDIRQHSAFHRDTIADRIAPK
jgi:hypothetical protein